MQYVACKFRISDTRTYTYTWDGEPLHDGDVVRVEDRSDDGWKKVYVVSTTDKAPPFQCKPILGRHVEEEVSGDTTLDNLDSANLETATPDPLDAPTF